MMERSSLAFIILVCTLTWRGPGVVWAAAASKLPQDPGSACEVQPWLQPVMAHCADTLQLDKCCTNLDALFFNSSSPSHGCLCLPSVLYSIATATAKLSVNFLHTLQLCQDSYASFRTHWASADTTSCPRVPIHARMGDVLFYHGPAAVLPSSRLRPPTSWYNMLQWGEIMQDVSDLTPFYEMLFGTRTLQLTYCTMMYLPLVWFVMHHALLSASSVYRQASPTERVLSCQHAVFALISAASIAPYSVVAVQAYLRAWTGSYLASYQMTLLVGVFLASRAVMYVVEGCVRSLVDPTIMVHHVICLFGIAMTSLRPNAAAVACGIVLDFVACCQAPGYLGFLGLKLRWPATFMYPLLGFARAWYILTHAAQTLILVFLFVNFAAMPGVFTPTLIACCACCVAITAIQFKYVGILGSMHRKMGQRLFTGDFGEGKGVLGSAAHAPKPVAASPPVKGSAALPQSAA